MDTQELVTVLPLSEADKKVGEEAAKVVVKDPNLHVRAIFWWFDFPSRAWKFAVASDEYRKKGPRFVYSTVRRILQKNDLLEQLPLDKVWAIDDTHDILSAIRSVARPGPHTQFQNCIFNGFLVAGAYFYFYSEPQKRRAVVRRKE